MFRRSCGNGHKLDLHTRLKQLAGPRRSAFVTKPQKRAIAFLKTCVQKRHGKKDVLEAVTTMLSPRVGRERRDFGALLLAEYVACRSGITVRRASFLTMGNPLWKARVRGRPTLATLTLLDSVRMTFLHAVTKVQVRGVVPEDALLGDAKAFLQMADAGAWHFWTTLVVLCTGFATRCRPWLRHAEAFCRRSESGTVDVLP